MSFAVRLERAATDKLQTYLNPSDLIEQDMTNMASIKGDSTGKFIAIHRVYVRLVDQHCLHSPLFNIGCIHLCLTLFAFTSV